MILSPGERFVYVFPFGSPSTGLSPVVRVSKNGEAFAVAGPVTEVGAGYYKVELTEAETGSVGSLLIRASDGSNPERSELIRVWDLQGEVEDAIIGATRNLAKVSDVDGAVQSLTKSQRALLDTEMLDTRNLVARGNKK